MKISILTASLLSTSALLASSAQAAVVQTWEFNGATTEGWVGSLHASTVAASGGFLSATVTGNDPQVTRTGSFTPTGSATWTTLTFRVRETQDSQTNAPTAPGVVTIFDATGLANVVNGGGARTITSPANGTVAADGWFDVEVDISAIGSSAITSIRVDPIGGAQSNSNSETNGNTFDVDYIRLNDTAPIPEPSSILFGGLGLLALLRRRR